MAPKKLDGYIQSQIFSDINLKSNIIVEINSSHKKERKKERELIQSTNRDIESEQTIRAERMREQEKRES